MKAGRVYLLKGRNVKWGTGQTSNKQRLGILFKQVIRNPIGYKNT